MEIRIVLPPLIYGRGDGLTNQSSIQIPLLLKASLDAGHVGVVGQGKPIWCGYSFLFVFARGSSP